MGASSLDLNYKVVFSGSEAASIAAFKKAEENKTPLIGYLYEPQWFMSQVPLVKVVLPQYTDGCQDDEAQVDCDYPETVLPEGGVDGLRRVGQPRRRPGQELQVDQRRPEPGRKLHRRRRHEAGGRAAAKWVDQNPDMVKTWLGK